MYAGKRWYCSVRHSPTVGYSFVHCMVKSLVIFRAYPWTLSNICGQTHDGVVSRHIGMAKVCKVFEMLAQSVFNGFGGWQILCFNSSCF